MDAHCVFELIGRITIGSSIPGFNTVVYEWPLNVLFNDARDFILTSRTNIKGLADDVNDDVQTLGNVFYR